MEQFQMQTAQNINISQNMAHLGDCMLAYSIDSFVILVYIVLMIILLVSLDIEFDDLWALFLVLNLPAILYYVLLETLMNGQTVGKSMVQVGAVKLDG